ncbi:hypothetical protein [Silicimonas sp. MF1-12-2]|uniref:hypothetical protein n=1 Tax=Silicimonas sp. MF1-12-2 TaxID=3384793 RepID=UPI0039B5B5FB
MTEAAVFFRDLKFKKGAALQVMLAEIHLPVRLGHRDAEKTFITPFTQQLAAAGLGTVTGFKPRRVHEDGIEGLDIFVGLTNSSRNALETVARMLEQLSAPYGSSVRLSETPGDPVIFGVTEGLELSIGTDITPDANTRKELVQACRSAIEDRAVSLGWARRADRTLFYFYGERFDEMKKRLDSVLDEDPRFASAVLRRMA